MALSQSERAALEARAAGLRLEISSLSVGTNDAQQQTADAQRDAALLEEISRLEGEKSEAVARHAAASGTVADAMAAMNAAAAKLGELPVEVSVPIVQPQTITEPAPALATAPEPILSAPVAPAEPVKADGEGE